MIDALKEHWRRTQETMQLFLGPELLEQTPPISPDDTQVIADFVRAEAETFTDEEIYWLPHDQPLDTALAMLGVEARLWQRAHKDRFAAYKEHAHAKNWLTFSIPKATPLDIATIGQKMRSTSTTKDQAKISREKQYISKYHKHLSRGRVISNSAIHNSVFLEKKLGINMVLYPRELNVTKKNKSIKETIKNILYYIFNYTAELKQRKAMKAAKK